MHSLRRFQAATVFALAAWASSPARADNPPAGTADPRVPQLDELGAYYEAHPELTTTMSSGWKPYNRARWFAETRPVPEGISAARIRRDAIAVGRARAQANDAARGAGWFNIGPANYSGRCVGIDFDPNDSSIVYVASASGGLWKSENGGDAWTPITEDLPSMAIGAVCVLPWNPNIVLIGTGEGSGAAAAGGGLGPFAGGIFKSTDAGATWNVTDRSYPLGTLQGFNVIEDNPATQTILAGASDGLWRSTDEGDTWTLVEGNGNFFDVAWKPSDANRVYITKGADPFINGQTDNGVKVSTDDGLTFAIVGSGQPPGATIAKSKIAVTAADPALIYVHYVNIANSMSLGTYRSTDDGATWQLRDGTTNMTGGQGWYNLAIAADPNDAQRLLTAGVNLYASNNGGINNVNLNSFPAFGTETIPHWDTHALEYEPGSSANVWIANDGGVWRSTDDGATWTSRREGIVTYQFYDICVAQSDPTFTMGGTQDNGIPGRVTDDTWFESTFIADGMVCNVNPANANVIYGEWQFGNHIKSSSGGQFWSSIQNGITTTAPWVTAVDEDPSLGNHLYTNAGNGIYRTTTGGNLWVNVAPHTARWISISRVDGNLVWTVSNFFGVWHTTDDGNTWTQSTTFPASGIETKIHAHPTDTASAFVTVGGYATGNAHMLKTTDFGATWADITGDFPDQPASTFVADPVRPDDWYVGSDTGVWKSDDGGAQWTLLASGMPSVVVTDLEIRIAARKLVAGTYGRGSWEMDLPGTSTSAPTIVATNPNLMLDPPFPNPVSDQAVFRFAARSETPLSLEVFDVGGRRVSIVARDVPSNGLVRNAVWTTDDVPGGVYFAVLRAGAERISRKVVVTR